MRKSYRAHSTKYSVRLEDGKIEKLKEIYGDLGITELLKSLIDEKIGDKEQNKSKVMLPITRIGGKNKIANEIVSTFDEHEIFVDTFGGSGAILFAKDKDTSKIEVYNDIFDELFNLMKTIQNRPYDLREKLLSMPNSKKLYEDIKKRKIVYENTVDRAAAYIFSCRYSFNNNTVNGGYRINKSSSIPQQIERIAEDLQFISQRLRNVVLENRNYKTLIKKYDSKQTLFYIDPPYVFPLEEKGKKDGLYERKFNRKDMTELVQILKKIEGKFVLSHYQNDFVESMMKGWTNKKVIEAKKLSGKIQNGKKPKVEEVIYYNYELEDTYKSNDDLC